MAVQFEPVCGPKCKTFWDDVGDPYLLSTHLADCLYYVSFRRHRPFKLPISCEIVQERWFWAPICRGRGYPDFGHAFSNCTYFRPCDRFSLSSIQRARRLDGEKKERKKEKKNSE